MASKYKPRIRKVEGYWDCGICPTYRGKGEAWRKWSQAYDYCWWLNTGVWPETQ